MVRSYRFYTEVIGLRPAAPMPPPTADDPEKDFVEYALNYSGTLADTFFVLMKRKGVTPSAEGAKLSVVGFKVPDISAAVERARAAGSTVIREPGPNAERGYALVTDPDGYTIEFIRGS
jgi:catechol 2,3-dioxygenase-like lactoylglutathione lyase family enzyme